MLTLVESQVDGGLTKPVLSFVSHQNDAMSFWSPDRGVGYKEGNQRGASYAEELLLEVRKTQNPVLVGSVIRAMIGSGIWGAVEIGFCHRLALEMIQEG